MHRTVSAAADNARRYLRRWSDRAPVATNRDWTGVDGTPFGDEAEYVDWLLTEIDDEAHVTHLAARFAEARTRISSIEVARQLRDQGERQEARTVRNAALVAAAGIGLGAWQTVGFDWPTYASVKAPFIALVTTVGLYL